MAAKAGIGYFAAVFGLGFLLGAARVLVVAPAVGVLPATLIELPIMLIAAWRICIWLVRKLSVSSSLGPRAAMGAVAFTLLIAAETVLGVVGFGQTLQQQLAGYRDTGPMLGLVAQIASALFPLAQTRVRLLAQSRSG
jgi:heme/copper-type cytochrome/quinol oxidase subunit 4